MPNVVSGPTLCDEFTRLSRYVWRVIGRTQPIYPPTSIGFRETTITDLLLWKLSDYGRRTGACAVHVPPELVTGADLELVIVEGNMGTHFRLQAKRLYSQRRHYKGMDRSTKHQGNLVYQIETLCAGNTGFIPLYLFYNWYLRAKSPAEKAIWGDGCGIISATMVQNLIRRRRGGYRSALPLAIAAPKMTSWEKLVCPALSMDLTQHALKAAKDIGAIVGHEWGEVRRPLSGQYLQLWQSRQAGDADGGDAGDFARPVIMVGNK